MDGYVLRGGATPELLQMRRTGVVLNQTWQPVMGHVEDGESSIDCLWRELSEECSLDRKVVVGAWALEQVHPYYLAVRDEIVMSPRFLVEVESGWEPVLNHEHDAHRWVPLADAEASFMWPGQHGVIAEIRGLRSPGSLSEQALRIL
ncbi:MAG: NUDIX domain-containing protein [Planctomycetota bacterium]